MQLLILAGVRATLALTFNEDSILQDCGFVHKLYNGTSMCLYFNICLLVAYKFHALYGQMTDFAIKGVLPTEHLRKRTNKVGIFVWMLGMCDWVTYMAVVVGLTKSTHYAALWNFEFC